MESQQSKTFEIEKNNDSSSLSAESIDQEKKGRTAIIRNFEDGTSMDELEEKFREFG